MAGNHEQMLGENHIHPRFKIELPLPFGVSDKLSVDQAELSALLQIAGVEHLTITGSFQDRTSRPTPSIAGINVKGEAVAGIARTDNVPLGSSTRSDDPRHIDNKKARWISISARLNLAQMQQVILDAGDSVRNPNAWASLISQGITQVVAEQGIPYLLSIGDKFDYIALVIGVPLLTWASLYGTDSALVRLIPWVLYENVDGLRDGAKYGHEFITRNGSGRRFSFTPYTEADRAALLWIMCQTLQPIKASNLNLC